MITNNDCIHELMIQDYWFINICLIENRYKDYI